MKFRLTLGVIGAVALPLLAGCGWTARDEFLRNQTTTVSARPGDGSVQASNWNDSRGRATSRVQVAARFEDPN